MWKLLLVLMIITTAIISCTGDDGVSPPEETRIYEVSFYDLPDRLKGYTGTSKTLNFSVQGRDQFRQSASDKTISFTLPLGIGSISPAEVVLDENGNAEVTIEFEIQTEMEEVIIQASIGGYVSTKTFMVQNVNPPVHISSPSEILHYSNNQPDTISFPITLQDSSGVAGAYPGVEIEFSSVDWSGNVIFGTLELTPATAPGFNRTVSLHTDGSLGTVAITLKVKDLELFSTTRIVVRHQSDLPASIILTATPDELHLAQDSTGTSVILATILNQDGIGIPGLHIELTTNIGNLARPAFTDSSGTTRAEFSVKPLVDLDPPLEPAVAEITATYSEGNIASSEDISIFPILEDNPISSIRLYANAVQMTANSGDSTKVRATCVLENGAPAPVGTEIHFTAHFGTITETPVQIPGEAGAAESSYIAGNTIGNDTLIAFTINDQDTIFSEKVLIALLPGYVANITLTADPDTIYTNYPNSRSIITARLTDEWGNPVRQGTYVNFTTTLGTITPSAITDINGIATAVLTPGVTAGTAIVTASCQGNVEIIDESIEVVFIERRYAVGMHFEIDRRVLHVSGSGLVDSATITLSIGDQNGEIVDSPFTVGLELINEPPPPQGCYFNNGDQSIICHAPHGIAVDILHAGHQIGGKLIRATTWPDSANNPDDIIEVILSSIAVVAGPPVTMDLDISDDGVAVGDDSWALEISTRMWDLYRNRVSDDYLVEYSIEPDIAVIEQVEGSNDAILTYQSIQTFETITITAQVEKVAWL